MDEKTENDDDFGLRLYEEIKKQGGTSALTTFLNYKQIQQMKASSREDLLVLFRSSEYLIKQRIRSDAPAELAAFFVMRAYLSRLAWGIVLG